MGWRTPCGLRVGGQRSPLRGRFCSDGVLVVCGDAWWRLGGQAKVELLEEHLEIGVWLGVPCEDEGAPIGGGEVDVEHLDSGKLVEHGAWCEAAGQGPEAGAQGCVEAIGEESHEDMGLDAMLELMVDGA